MRGKGACVCARVRSEKRERVDRDVVCKFLEAAAMQRPAFGTLSLSYSFFPDGVIR